MLELPEAIVIAEQMGSTIKGKSIANVIAEQSPHKFAWYYGDPQNYIVLLKGKTINEVNSFGNMIEVKADNAVILFGDGVRVRFHDKNEKLPKKHQLLIEFDDSSAISGSIQMYGGLWCFPEGEFDNIYYDVAKKKPSPLSKEFSNEYFSSLISAEEVQNISAKAFLATEQRIPGLGNGVLQDILYNAKVHPKRKVNSLTESETSNLFQSIKTTLNEMVSMGCRDTEKDLFDQVGGYKTKVSRNTLNQSCPICGGIIKKEAYLGGSIYYCDGCQKV